MRKYLAKTEFSTIVTVFDRKAGAWQKSRQA